MSNYITGQIKFNGGYVDESLNLFETIADLATMPSDDRFEGRTVIVKKPVAMECWLVGGKMKSNWKIKTILPVKTHADLDSVTDVILASFSKMIGKGVTVIVEQDEDNDGKMSEYWNTSEAGSVTWELKSNGGASDDFLEKDCISGEDKEE